MPDEIKAPCSRLEDILRAGHFAVTVELNPPDSADPEDVYKAARILAEVCDGINAVDASGANCHISSVAMCMNPFTRSPAGTGTGSPSREICSVLQQWAF